MHVELLHPVPHTPLHATLGAVFRTASRVQLAVAFLTGPGASTFLRLVPAGKVRAASRVAASIRWPTNLDALAQLSAQMPGGVYLHRGLLLPEETNHDRPLMHSKVAYVEHAGSDEVDVLVGSHNWTGQALDGNNLEATVRVRCPGSDPFAADTRRHLDACFAESELFDAARLDDYKAIQAALHGGPPRDQGDAAGFVKDSVVVIHAEEEPELSARLGELHLYLPIYDGQDDELFDKDQQIHLYIYDGGKLFDGHDPLQRPTLYTGRVDMSNRPNDRVQRRVDCTIKDFGRPVLTSLVGDIPVHSRPLVRQLVAVLQPERRRRVLFYHRGSGGPRFRRQVEGRPPSPDEVANLAAGQVAPVGRRPIQPGAYTRASVGPDGAFVYEVPADPSIHCVVSLPGRQFYPTELRDDFLSRFHRFPEDVRSRVDVAFEPCPTFREYVYRCTHRVDLDSGDWS